MILIVNRWNQLDLFIILLSIVGIVLEEMNSELPINPTIIRVMRVLRIARGGFLLFLLKPYNHTGQRMKTSLPLPTSNNPRPPPTEFEPKEETY